MGNEKVKQNYKSWLLTCYLLSTLKGVSDYMYFLQLCISFLHRVKLIICISFTLAPTLLKLSLTHIYAWLRLLYMYVIVFEDDIYNFVNFIPICNMYIAATTFNAEVKETCS